MSWCYSLYPPMVITFTTITGSYLPLIIIFRNKLLTKRYLKSLQIIICNAVKQGTFSQTFLITIPLIGIWSQIYKRKIPFVIISLFFVSMKSMTKPVLLCGWDGRNRTLIFDFMNTDCIISGQTFISPLITEWKYVSCFQNVRRPILRQCALRYDGERMGDIRSDQRVASNSFSRF